MPSHDLARAPSLEVAALGRPTQRNPPLIAPPVHSTDLSIQFNKLISLLYHFPSIPVPVRNVFTVLPRQPHRPNPDTPRTHFVFNSTLILHIPLCTARSLPLGGLFGVACGATTLDETDETNRDERVRTVHTNLFPYPSLRHLVSCIFLHGMMMMSAL